MVAVSCAHCDARGGELVGVGVDINKLLAEFFEIDLDKVEAEKRALLDRVRSDNTAHALVSKGGGE